jgi:hypothetical protein
MSQLTTPKSLPNIRPFLLWDVNMDNFDFSIHKQLVIERCCTLGNISDYKEILSFYGLETVKNELLKSASLDPKSLSFFSKIFNIPVEKFKCYSKRP